MANSEAVDLMGLGKHCAYKECGQLDFLPFRCTGCKRVYCLDHRMQAEHACTASVQECDSSSVLVCPLCARAVPVQGSEDPNLSFERHTTSGKCDPSNYDRVHRKPRCPVPGCRERLTLVNGHQCRDCGARVCLRHRLGMDHACPGPRLKSSLPLGRPGPNALGNLWNRVISSSSSRPRPAPQPRASQSAPAPKAPPADSAPPPLTSARAAAVAAAERRRSGQAAPAAGAAGAACCPHCGRAFARQALLQTHLEREHGGAGKDGACVVC